MANTAGYKLINAPISGTLLHQVKLSYSFAADGGDTGTYTLGELADNMIAHSIFANCTSLNSAGAATVQLAVSGFGISQALSYSNANSEELKVSIQLTEGAPNTGSYFFPIPAASGTTFDIIVAGAALTAGSIDIYVVVGPA